MDAVAFEVRAIDNKMLEFQYLIDILIDLIDPFDVACLMMIQSTPTHHPIFTDKGRHFTLITETNLMDRFFVATGDPSERIANGFQCLHEDN